MVIALGFARSVTMEKGSIHQTEFEAWSGKAALIKSYRDSAVMKNKSIKLR